MRTKIDKIFSWITIALGVIHMLLVQSEYSELNDNVHIFIGLGLTFIALGELNLSRILSSNQLTIKLCGMINFIFLIYLLLPVIILSVRSPQRFVAIVVVMALFINSIIDLKNFQEKCLQ